MNGKIALGALGGIGLITTVSVVSSRSGSLDTSREKEMPPFRFLSEDEGFMKNQQDNSSSRFGYKYAGLLVGDADINDVGWEGSYENLTKDLKNQGSPSADTFKVVQTSPQIPNSADSLKAGCSKIYKVDVESNSDNHDSIFNNSSVGKYCSPAQQPRLPYKNQQIIIHQEL